MTVVRSSRGVPPIPGVASASNISNVDHRCRPDGNKGRNTVTERRTTMSSVADVLRISPSAVFEQITQPEDKLDIKLIERRRHPRRALHWACGALLKMNANCMRHSQEVQPEAAKFKACLSIRD